MRSEVVVLPASTWAMMPMFLSFLVVISGFHENAGPSQVFGAPSGGRRPRMRLPWGLTASVGQVRDWVSTAACGGSPEKHQQKTLEVAVQGFLFATRTARHAFRV